MKKALLAGILFIGLVGCSSNEISEVHQITEINENFVRGENVIGTGEGIYYSIEEMKDAGIDEIKLGDKIKFSWTEEDFYNDDWEEFKAEKVN